MSARDYALTLIDQTPLPGWPARLVRQRVGIPTDPRDLGLAEQIHIGVIKNYALLRHCIDHYTARKTVDPLVSKILAIGLYQLRFLTRIPESAIVDQAVEQTRKFGRRHASGFVNAVLRRAVREPDVPLPARDADPVVYATIALSHAGELVDRLVKRFGIEQAVAICEHDNREPPTLVRAHSAPAATDVHITPHEQAGMYVVTGAKRATFAEWAASGQAQVQDATSAATVPLLQLAPGQDVLDRCAGLGTKTLQIVDALEGTGWIMAVDPSEARCATLRELLLSRSINTVAVLQEAMLCDIPQLKRPAFDRMLLDVPCSNSGVLARRPEARYQQTAAALASLEKLQDAILTDSADYLRPGGILVYSTCSIWPSENESRIAAFLESRPDYQLLTQQNTLPACTDDATRYHDGGFAAVLRRG